MKRNERTKWTARFDLGEFYPTTWRSLRGRFRMTILHTLLLTFPAARIAILSPIRPARRPGFLRGACRLCQARVRGVHGVAARLFQVHLPLLSALVEADMYYPANVGRPGHRQRPRAGALCSTALTRAGRGQPRRDAGTSPKYSGGNAAGSRKNYICFYAEALLVLPASAYSARYALSATGPAPLP